MGIAQNYMNGFLGNLQGVKRAIRKLRRQLHTLDLAIMDVEHFIENENTQNIEKITNYYLAMQKLRRERREVKNQIELLELLENQTEKYLEVANKNFENKKSELESLRERKVYIPRVISELTNILNIEIHIQNINR